MMNGTPTLGERTIKGVIWLGSSQVIYQGLSWVCTIFVMRTLSPGDYGLMSMAMIIVGFVQMFGSLGTDLAVIQKKDLGKVALDSVFWINLMSGTFFAAAVCLSAPFISLFFAAGYLTLILRVLSVNFIICALYAIPYTLLTKELDFHVRSPIEIAANIFSSVLTVVLAAKGFGVWSLVFGFTSRNLMLLIILTCRVRYYPKLVFSLTETATLINYGMHVLGSRVSWYVYSNADYFVVGKFLGHQALGYYTMAFELSSMPLGKLIDIISPVAMASFSKLQDNIDQLRNYFLKFEGVLTIVIFPALAGLALIAGDVINVILTPKWKEAILPLQILALVGIFKCIYIVIPIMLNAKGKPKINMYYSMACTIIMPVAFFIGTFYGLKGVAYAWLVVFPWLTLAMVYIGCREAGVALREFALCLSPAIISTLSMVSILLITKGLLKHYAVNWGILGFYVLLGAMIYGGVLVIFFPEFRSDIVKILRRGIAEAG